MEHWWNDTGWKKNRRSWRKPCPSVIFSFKITTCTGPGSNPALRDKRPGTNHLTNDTAKLTKRDENFTFFVFNYFLLSCKKSKTFILTVD
jgi:hypothetical protein